MVFVVATCLVVCAPAEVIHLKNGRTIWADHVRDDGTHIEYDLGDDSYAIPKAVVDHVEAGGVPPQFASSAPAGKATTFRILLPRAT